MQGVWVSLGVCAMVFFSVFNYKWLFKFSVPLMMFAIMLLMIVLIPSIGSVRGGARGWIDLGPFNLQPTELAKFATIIYLASWFVQKEKRTFMQFLVLLGLMLFLIVLQPDVGTAIVVFLLSVMIYYIAGRDLMKLLLFVPLGAVAFYGLIKAAPYRFNRLVAFLDPSADPQGVSYHINQILISLASGGLIGKGFGASRQKYLFLPEAHTDSIFAIIGEEFGFIGAAVFVAAFAMLIYLLYRVYATTSEPFGKLLAGGIFVFFSLQALVNLGGMVALMPLTGVPLPFISYGGSHIIPSFALMGIAINILRQNEHPEPESVKPPKRG
jgi:cell division protein FtsW